MKTNHQRNFVAKTHRWKGRLIIFRKSEFANVHFVACSGFESINGHRGMARQVRGAKKFVRTRIRFHENQQLKKEIKNEGY